VGKNPEYVDKMFFYVCIDAVKPRAWGVYGEKLSGCSQMKGKSKGNRKGKEKKVCQRRGLEKGCEMRVKRKWKRKGCLEKESGRVNEKKRIEREEGLVKVVRNKLEN